MHIKLPRALLINGIQIQVKDQPKGYDHWSNNAFRVYAKTVNQEKENAGSDETGTIIVNDELDEEGEETGDRHYKVVGMSLLRFRFNEDRKQDKREFFKNHQMISELKILIVDRKVFEKKGVEIEFIKIY